MFILKQSVPKLSQIRHYASVPAKRKETPYEVLSLPPHASRADIKRRYYEMAKTLHPDRPTGNLERFQLVNRAYEILSNPSKRDLYERSGLGWDVSINVTTNPRPQAYHWGVDHETYQGGDWSNHGKPRFMKNETFISIVAGVSVALGILQFCTIMGGHGTLQHAADRHHVRTSKDLERARTEAQLFGNQRAVERMMNQRMRYWRENTDNTAHSKDN